VRDHLGHRLGFPQDLMVPEAQHNHALRVQMGRAVAVPLLGVLAPIDLDGQARLLAIEVEDIGTEGVLAAELRPFDSLA
jgi:hypothetical protein